MPEMQQDADLVDFCQISPELSRDFRGLRAWLPIKLFGIDAFRSSLDEKLDLARWATDQLGEIPDMEILAEPQLSLTAFRWAPAGHSEDGLNELNRELLTCVNVGLPRIGGQVNACVLLSDPNPAGVRSFRCAGAQGSRSKPGSAKVDLAEAV